MEKQSLTNLEHDEVATNYPFFPVSITKFVVMSICSFGLYELFWAYSNWFRISQRSDRKLRPSIRGLLGFIFYLSLFKRLRGYATQHGLNVTWSPAVQFASYWFFSLFPFIIDGGRDSALLYLSFLRLLPLLSAVGTIQRIHAVTPSYEDNNSSFSKWNLVAICLGLLLIVFASVPYTE
jgi:hypothetical protein